MVWSGSSTWLESMSHTQCALDWAKHTCKVLPAAAATVSASALGVCCSVASPGSLQHVNLLQAVSLPSDVFARL